jgi:hypothetical protein
MLSGECHECGKEYKDLRKHWSKNTCQPEPGKSSKVTVECENCGKKHREWRYRVEKNNGSCCSPECRHQNQRNGETVECAWCGAEIYRANCQLNEMGDYPIDHHFCDKECEKRYKQHNWVREGHPRWEGGKAGIDTVRNCLSEFSWYRIAEWARQDECQMCGGDGGERALDVHHIIPVSAGGTNHPDNLTTLCIPCHRKTEQYTKKIVEPHLLKPGL